MSKIIFISNRLPVTIQNTDTEIQYQKSIGGLATGLKSYHEKNNSLWVGWTGIAEEELEEEEKGEISKELKNTYQCVPVFLQKEDIDLYYYGFSNRTIWPLFHYFPTKTEYNFETWEAYRKINETFFETVEPYIREDDIIWIHDYQLMLLPQMIREKYPDTKIGFFLHIPFPSYEIFRLLVWREEILRGILGANLIGFHTYDYVRHFLSSVRRILGVEHNLYKLNYEEHSVQVDAFPMGIDYNFFAQNKGPEKISLEMQELVEESRQTQTILSIDRLDYTKGIVERIRGFQHLIEHYPNYQGKVRLNLIVAPSRVEVEMYDMLKREIEELVSEINGRFGTVSWMPIWFFFRSFSQEELIIFYKNSDVLLVTPLRDGMNLVAKEYIASRNDYKGMLVISETAGAASELGEAVLVNANDYGKIALGIKDALEMPDEEKIERNQIMHQRLSRYNVQFWADDFLSVLQTVIEEPLSKQPVLEFKQENAHFIRDYQAANKRILFLDYDGTLVGFEPIPEQAKPDAELKELLCSLSNNPKNIVVIISGRDRHFFERWMDDLDIVLIASHGLWIRKPGEEWMMTVNVDDEWKESVYHILQRYVDRIPGSLIEEKEFSLAWHYRQCEPDMVALKLIELREALVAMTQTMSIGVQDGNRVLEVKDSRVNKGNAAYMMLIDDEYDFILGAGDDLTDEDLFSALPSEAYSIKIGKGVTSAYYFLKSHKVFRNLLQKLVDLQ